MPQPREITKGQTYLITRRVTQRQFLLKPSAFLNRVFLYCLAVAASKFGVLIHSVTVMSNHYHLIATDPFGVLPAFCNWLHEFVARVLNAYYGRRENLWASEPPSYVQLVGAEDVLAKTIYLLTNPTSAGLVSRGEEWPGVRLFTPGTRRIERPAGFFREDGPTPAVAELNIVPAPLGVSSHEGLRLIKEGVAEREAAIRAEFRSEGKTFLGARHVLAQRTDRVAASVEPKRELRPRVASRNKWRRIEALQRSAAFLAAYRDAMRAWARGAFDVLFPPGTYQMARQFGARVAPA